MAKRELRQVEREVRSDGGQPATGPRGVRDQSMARISAPMSPPPSKHRGDGRRSGALPVMSAAPSEQWLQYKSAILRERGRSGSFVKGCTAPQRLGLTVLYSRLA